MTIYLTPYPSRIIAYLGNPAEEICEVNTTCNLDIAEDGDERSWRT